MFDEKIIITGGGGFLGSHIYDKLIKRDYIKPYVPRKDSWDLRRLEDCNSLIDKDIDIIIHVAADVGGIGYLSKFPGKIMYNNIMMGFNLLEVARKKDINKFVFIGSSCAYPNNTSIPYKEEDLWNGYPDINTSSYGIAKRTIMELIKKYSQEYGMNGISLIPTNLYGPRDHFDLNYSHVIPSLIRKFIEAKDPIEIWGTGKATRDFLYIDDAVDGIIDATDQYCKSDPINIGSGGEVTIEELVEIIEELTNYKGEIVWDYSKPDGTPRRCLDISKAKKEFNFKPKVELREGLKRTIDWYKTEFIKA
jgi:GDP-L-fucose synthase